MDLINNDCTPTARKIAEALGETTHIKDFAKFTAEVVINEYGQHNFVPFITELVNTLQNEINR